MLKLRNRIPPELLETLACQKSDALISQDVAAVTAIAASDRGFL